MKAFNWILTDVDCCQYMRNVTEAKTHNVYEGVQLIEYPDELSDGIGYQYGIAHAVVDLDDYTAEELEDILRGYYDELERTFISDRIKAECVFETFALENIDYNAHSREGAEQIIQKILWENFLIRNGADLTDKYVFMPICIEAKQVLVNLLKLFDELYGNTDQELNEWAAEFQVLTRMLIHHNALLLNPVYLEVDKRTLLDILMAIPCQRDRELYMDARRHIGLKAEI